MAKPQNGFTFAEIMVCLAIFSLIIIGIFEVMLLGNRGWNEDMSRLELQQTARIALDGMTREVRQSREASIDLDPAPANDRITFGVIDPDTEDWIEGIEYFLDSGDVNNDGKADQILREYPAGTYKVLANDVDSLEFSLSDDVLAIQLGIGEYSFKQKVRLRNE